MRRILSMDWMRVKHRPKCHSCNWKSIPSWCMESRLAQERRTSAATRGKALSTRHRATPEANKEYQPPNNPNTTSSTSTTCTIPHWTTTPRKDWHRPLSNLTKPTSVKESNTTANSTSKKTSRSATSCFKDTKSLIVLWWTDMRKWLNPQLEINKMIKNNNCRLNNSMKSFWGKISEPWSMRKTSYKKNLYK